MKRFTQIKGLSQLRRLPRLGRVRGGVKIKKKGVDKRCQHKPEESCLFCTRPTETPHFVCPPEVTKVYGEYPIELDIMIPVNDLAQAFPQAYEMYSTGRGLKCTGDGAQALQYNEESKSMVEIECPCALLEQKKCNQRGHLSFILPKVSVGGVYTMTTTSFHSIVDINSSLEYVTALIGRFAMVPLKLKREPRETHYDGKRQTHYTCRIELEGNIDFLNSLKENTSRILSGPQYVLPAPERENPAYDDGPVYVEGSLTDTPVEVLDDAIETSKVEAPAITKELLIEKIAGVNTKDDLQGFIDWSTANKPLIEKTISKDDRELAANAFKRKHDEIEKEHQQGLFVSYESALKSAVRVEDTDKIMEIVEKSLKSNELKVKLKFLRDSRVQELKKKKGD